MPKEVTSRGTNSQVRTPHPSRCRPTACVEMHRVNGRRSPACCTPSDTGTARARGLQGNSYTSYSDGGYSYSNKGSDGTTSSSYYKPSGSSSSSFCARPEPAHQPTVCTAMFGRVLARA